MKDVVIPRSEVKAGREPDPEPCRVSVRMEQTHIDARHSQKGVQNFFSREISED